MEKQKKKKNNKTKH